VVEPYTEEITALLTVEDTYTNQCGGALSPRSRGLPDSVEHVTPTFVELLSDENPLVRENACWALGHLCAPDATSALEDRAHDDDNADVRTGGHRGLARSTNEAGLDIPLADSVRRVRGIMRELGTS